MFGLTITRSRSGLPIVRTLLNGDEVARHMGGWTMASVDTYESFKDGVRDFGQPGAHRHPHPMTCPRCGSDSVACSKPFGEPWQFDYCETCGSDESGYIETAPPVWDAYDEPELPDDPYAYSEEMRRLHLAQV